ncbi:hypothetical protein EDEG_01431 [Edhazardia aedis USNM 41457]|uniref:Amino acid permease/ SLC12A domain-containing protein n=1 Tax=Edhazardia aedis (strain USNM 41457) TaxID=1003232 RepID=J9DSK2_EDHAE|nr:hypothetical protein EDEG_01431 [Edhazardia aedis USNM 41457]|eukprot:EJW04307.1 hypothetical protein EDEG_01431 [Edhazardia aedis USNM 41457]
MVEKKINARQLLLILICNIIGAGIFYVPHLVAKETSKNGISLSCWIFSAIIAVMFGQCYAELGSTYPYEGGDAWYLKLAYGDIVSYIYTFVSLFVILPCGCAVMLCTMCDMFPCSELRIKVLKASIAIAIGLINWAGSKYVFRIQYFLTMLKVMVVLFFVFFLH